jgi:hypothetical protein
MSDRMVMRLGHTPSDIRNLNLSRAIARRCPTGFAEARLETDFGEGGARMRLACTPEDGSETAIDLDAAVQDEIRALLEEIHTASEPGGRAWRRCVVTLRKGGGFLMDIDY